MKESVCELAKKKTSDSGGSVVVVYCDRSPIEEHTS